MGLGTLVGFEKERDLKLDLEIGRGIGSVPREAVKPPGPGISGVQNV
jgi:hypothetical protein